MKKRNNLIIFVGFLIIALVLNVRAENVSCTGVFSQEFINAMNNYVYTPIKWATPVLLLVLTSFDFAGVVFSGKKEGMDKAKNNFLKRTIAALIIFFAPDIINLLVKFVNDQSIASCTSQFK